MGCGVDGLFQPECAHPMPAAVFLHPIQENLVFCSEGKAAVGCDQLRPQFAGTGRTQGQFFPAVDSFCQRNILQHVFLLRTGKQFPSIGKDQ